MRLSNLLLVVVFLMILGGVLAVNRTIWVVVLAIVAVAVFAGVLALTRRP